MSDQTPSIAELQAATRKIDQNTCVAEADRKRKEFMEIMTKPEPVNAIPVGRKRVGKVGTEGKITKTVTASPSVPAD